MFARLHKTIKHYVRSGGFWAGTGDKNMASLHKAIIVLKCCNIEIFIIYVPVLQDAFI